MFLFVFETKSKFLALSPLDIISFATICVSFQNKCLNVDKLKTRIRELSLSIVKAIWLSII